MRRTSIALTTLSLLLLCSFASADVLVSESFDYDAGPVDGQDGGEGWADAWLISETLFETDFKMDVTEMETPLVYQLPDGGGFINGGNRALRFVNESEEETLSNDSNALTRPLEDFIDLEEVYVSYLYKYDGDGTETGGFIDDNDFVVWWFNNAGGPQLGLKGNGGNGSVPDDFVGRVSGAFAPPQQAYAPGIDISDEAGTLNDTWLIVGKMSMAGNSESEFDYDQFDLWVNPGLGDADSPDASGRAVPEESLQEALDLLGMRIFNEEPGDAMIWDELRIGETWEDVVGPLGDQDVMVEMPEPVEMGCVIPEGGLAGDVDGDGSVAFPDFLILSNNFGGMDLSYQEGDLDCDGAIAFSDFLVLSNNFGATAGASSVPEPTSAALACWLIAGLALARRSKNANR